MSGPPVVDVHVHVLPPGPDGVEPERDPYEIWEYGDHPVEVCQLAGTIGQVEQAMTGAGCDHFVIVNMFVADNELAKLAAEQPPDRPAPTLESHREVLVEGLVTFNTWALDLARDRTDATVFVAVDPHVLGGRAGADHLTWACDQGARGVKIHPIAQEFHPGDPRMEEIWTVCEDTGLGVVAHTGASRHDPQWAEPAAYAALLEAHPRLNLVLAHMGGAHWDQIVPLADAFPGVCFDLCEIIAWTGAPNAPSRADLAGLIRRVGADRVMFGTDFPWYQVDRTIEAVMDLPLLADEERHAILGVNAVRRLGLPVDI